MFEIRNIQYAFNTDVRNLSSVKGAMKAHRDAHPNCAWCGRSKGIHVHHIVPVKYAPGRAADPTNLQSLCGKRCHITVGHLGNWKTYNANVVASCESKELVDDAPKPAPIA